MTYKLANELLHQIGKAKGQKDSCSLLKFRNGTRHFILPLYKLTINFCSTMQDSQGARQFVLSDEFRDFVSRNPSVEFIIEPVNGRRPVFRAMYLNSGPAPIDQARRERCVCLSNLQGSVILGILEELRGDSGQPRRRFKPNVYSDTPAIRPIWSPFHDNSEFANPLCTLRQIVAEKRKVEEDAMRRSLAKLPSA